MADIFVTVIKKDMIDPLKAGLMERGFELTKPQYTLFQARKTGVTCTLYESLKLTVQGRNMKELLEFFIEPEILKSPEYTYRKELAIESLDKRARIGVDEAGKGDYFGPLCVAGVMADEQGLYKLIELGVRDSKTLSDEQIRKLAEKIRKAFPYHVLVLRPKKYNELYASFHNLNSLLAWGHATVIERLVEQTGVNRALIDKFANESVVENALRKKRLKISLEQRVRGEADVVVAAASILARWAFVEFLEETGKKFGVSLPKGAAAHVVEAARRFVREQGREALGEVAKLHFKITGLVTAAAP